MIVPIHNCGELNVYLDDTDGEIYLTVETNDRTRTGMGYSMSIRELNRYLNQFKPEHESSTTTHGDYHYDYPYDTESECRTEPSTHRGYTTN